MIDSNYFGGVMSSNITPQSEAKKVTFWISQIVIIIATVGGVYLAASQGLKQAMQFDAIKSVQNNYYLRKSLQNEMADNVGYMREYIGKVNQRVVKPPFNLETFVWNSMTYSSTSLETPSDLLREAQKFYRQAAEIMANPNWQDRDRAKAMGELADRIEKEVLPRFEADTKKLRDNLKVKNIDV
jgi:hypothetical protein